MILKLGVEVKLNNHIFCNALVPRAKLTTSGEDAGENIMAATSARWPAKRNPER